MPIGSDSEVPTGRLPMMSAQAKTRLVPVLAVTMLNSLSTTVLTTAIYFLTEQAYGFSNGENYGLGLVMGATYIVGSLAAGPIIRWATTGARAISHRTMLGILVVLMGSVCSLPILNAFDEGEQKSSWPIWVLMATYSPLSGMLWPLVESYLSGARQGHQLRSAIGRWNVSWSLAGAIGTVFVSPLLKNHAIAAIALFGVSHFLSVPLLYFFKRSPGTHGHEEHAPHPTVYRQLLITFRIMLPVSYLLVNTLMPFLPTALGRLGIKESWQPLMVAIYLFTRSGTFLGLELWPGWHGRWWLAVAGPVILLAGFAGVIGARWAGSEGGVWVTITGLVAMGLGMAAIYVGALYYGMEVGKAEVEAGGAHEALIGVGYAGGPLLGLSATLAQSKGVLSSDGFEAAMLGGVGLVAGAVAIVVVRRVMALSKGKS